MLVLLTDPQNTFLIDGVTQAADSLDSQMGLKVIDFSFNNRPSLEEVPLFGRDIALSSIAIIDADIRPLRHIDVRVASVAGYLLNDLAQTDNASTVLQSLNRRMLFVTTQEIRDCEVYKSFGGFYSFISTKGRDKDEVAALVAEWLREMHGENVPRIFISYCSTRKGNAEQIAHLLRGRGARVWFDDLSIPFGASITKEVNRGLSWCTHFILLVDQDFFDSQWASTEFESILNRKLSRINRGLSSSYADPLAPVLLPLFFVDPNHEKIPPMLRNIKGLNMQARTMEDAVDMIWPALIA